jgi:hypothetical protein
MDRGRKDEAGWRVRVRVEEGKGWDAERQSELLPR